ncbi:MAG: N-acetylmuramoyl-L-alanine amidase [Psychroserpens sp.]|nr:N-acetylmuramoyl-L-alanine amidase [Psychroserpens sp.]
MELIERFSKYGGGYQSPEKFIIHAMGDIIKINKDLPIKNKKGLVIRTIKAGDYPAVEWLEQLRISAHYIVGPKVSWHCRGDNQIGYHAGGRHNLRSIGFELTIEGAYNLSILEKKMAEKEYYTHSQYTFVAKQIARICSEYGLKGIEDRIFGHDEVAPDRKNDPDKWFDYEKLYALIRQYSLLDYGYNID